MGFIGTILIIIAIAMFIVSLVVDFRKEDKEVPNGYGGKKTLKAHPKILSNWNWKWSVVTGTLGLLLIILNMSIFYAEAGYKYFVVGPTGHKQVISTEGYHLVIPFSKIQPWQKFIDVKVTGVKDEADEDEIEGKMQPIGIRFIDQVTADAYVSVRFELPQDDESFIELAVKFRSMSNLVNNTLIPTVKEQMINTAYMFAAQNYISGEAQNFRQTFEEQLKYGTYAVVKTEFKDTVYSDIGDSASRSIKEIKTTYDVKKIYEAGIPKRIPHEITENHIIVSQVIVDKLLLEETFKKRLEAQRDESAKRQLEQQKIETAKASQLRIIAEGERDKAEERVKQEKEQVKVLIEIETKLKKENTNLELATIQLETEKKKAEALKVQKDAEAYANRQLVNAGLTPQERAEWDYKIAVGVAEKLGGPDGLTLPQNYIMSGGNGNTSQNDIMNMLLLQIFKQGQK